MELPFVSKKKYDEVVYKLECLLCHATGGRLSKHTYLLNVMESAVTDHIQECCDDANNDYASEIFAEIDNMLVDFVSLFHGNISKATIEQNKDKQQVNSVALSVINTTRKCLAELKKKYTEEKE